MDVHHGELVNDGWGQGKLKDGHAVMMLLLCGDDAPALDVSAGLVFAVARFATKLDQKREFNAQVESAIDARTRRGAVRRLWLADCLQLCPRRFASAHN